MDKNTAEIIATIRGDMDAHAHDAMNMPTPDLGKYCEIVGAYRGMQHCLNIIDKVLRAADYEEETK